MGNQLCGYFQLDRGHSSAVSVSRILRVYRSIEQCAVRQSIPTSFNRFYNSVVVKPASNTSGRTVIKENEHRRASMPAPGPEAVSRGSLQQNAGLH